MRTEDVPEDMVVAATMALTRHGLETYQVEPLIRGITGRVPPHGLRAALAAVYPLIRAAVIEECAAWHMAEAERLDADRAAMPKAVIPHEWSRHHRRDAMEIRALKEKSDAF